MNIQYFAESLAVICAHSLVAQGRELRWLVIANPTSGGFKIRSRWKKCRRALEKSRAAALTHPLRRGSALSDIAAQFTNNPALASCGLIPTEGPDSGQHITNAFIAQTNISDTKTEQARTAGDPFYLIITAGGDGTSMEVLSVICRLPGFLREKMAVLRLPMGTGNDGADSPRLADALQLLLQPTNIEYVPALRLHTSPGGPAMVHSPFLAFNILSVGLDAFVTHMTNKMKGKLPGDFYKLWVNIAALLYDRLYTVDFIDIKAFDEQGGETASIYEKILLIAVGASGHRTYGSQKKILPDSRNVCVVKQMSLMRKIALKNLMSTGEHISNPEALLFNARRVEISCSHPILAQMDGEAVLLQCRDFPVAIELTDPVIPVLRPAYACQETPYSSIME